MAQVALIPKFLTSDVRYERKQLLIRLIQLTTPAAVPMLPVSRNLAATMIPWAQSCNSTDQKPPSSPPPADLVLTVL